MKTAVSIPDDILRKADRLARRMNKSRSELVNNALSEYLARHASHQVTTAVNEVCAVIGVETDAFTTAASRRVLKNVEW